MDSAAAASNEEKSAVAMKHQVYSHLEESDAKLKVINQEHVEDGRVVSSLM